MKSLNLCKYIKNPGVVVLALLILLAAAFMPGSEVHAGGGNGSGGGGGSSIALSMTESSPADGATGVSTGVTISCRFSHNVAETSVGGANTGHFSLATADGKPVDIKAYVADVQIEFDKRQYIYVKPVSVLATGTQYVLTITPGISAKNGMTTSATQTVKFTTAGTAPQTSQAQEAAAPAAGQTSDAPASGSEAGNADGKAQTETPGSLDESEEEITDENGDENAEDASLTEAAVDSETAAAGSEEEVTAGENSSDNNDGSVNDTEKAGSCIGYVLAALATAVAVAGGVGYAVWRRRKKSN